MNKRLTMADKILYRALSVGLNVTYDKETSGDGNCFYHAVVECLVAKEIRNEFNNDSYLLRQKVVDFVDRNKNLSFVQNFIASVVQVENINFSSLLLEQRNLGTHAIELFVKATAMFLNIPILVVMERSTRSWPYSIYWPQDSGEVNTNMTMEGFSGDFIVIGNSETDDHFQSLRFVGKLPWDHSSSQDVDFQVNRGGITLDVPQSNTLRRKGDELDCPLSSKQRKYDFETDEFPIVLDFLNSLVNSVDKCSKLHENRSGYNMPDADVNSVVESLKKNVVRRL